MAPRHGCWRFGFGDAERVFDGIARVEDLWSDEVSSFIDRIRADPSHRSHLTMMRIPPDDHEVWEEILSRPGHDADDGFVVASRISLLLIGVSSPALALQTAPFYVESLLGAIGWSPPLIGRAIRGIPLADFFAEHMPHLRPLLQGKVTWMTGGWLNAEASDRLLVQCREAEPLLETAIPALAAELHPTTDLSHAVIEKQLRAGLRELTAMLGQTQPEGGLWLIQD